jgi:hypothetical protein
VDRIGLSQDRDKWRILATATMNMTVLLNAIKLWTGSTTGVLSCTRLAPYG